MKPPPRVRLIQSWQTYSKGAFIHPNAMTRNWLIATGRAVLDEEVKATPTPAPEPQRFETVPPSRPAQTRKARAK